MTDVEKTIGFTLRFPSIEVTRLGRLPGESKRAAEQRCVAQMLRSRFGEDTQLEYHPSGAPFLPTQPKVCLSISHSDCYVAIAYASKPIGIDIEDLGDQVDRVEARFVHPRELDRLEVFASRRLALHLLWSAKEAAYKLVNPSSKSLKEFTLALLDSYSLEGHTAVIVLRTSSDVEVEVDLVWADDYVMAMANYA